MIPKYFYSIFKSVQLLQEYLGLDFDELDISQDDRSALYELSQQILIVIRNPTTMGLYSSELKFVPAENGTGADETMEDVLVDICVYILSNWQLSNLITAGCTLASDKNSIRMKFNNTLLSQIISNKAWNVIFACIDIKDFCDLFLNAVILHRLPNGAYYQLSGTPLSFRDTTLETKKGKASQTAVDNYASTFLFDIASHHSDVSRYLDSLLVSKKRRTSVNSNGQPNKAQKLSRRQKKKLKQASATKVNTTSGPTSRVTTIDRSPLFYAANVINPSTDQVLMKLPKDHMLKQGRSTNLDGDFLDYCMTNIFPREVITPNRKKKFLKKSQPIKAIVKNLQIRHGKIHFLEILDRRCPKKALHSTIKRAASPYQEVSEFIQEIVRKSFPVEFWGSKHNFSVVCRAIKHFISRRSSESISMSEIMHQFKILECKWLSSSHNKRVVPSDLRKRKIILQQALCWFFDGFILPTLKSFFYVTEHSKFGKTTFYYRRDTWHSITEPHMQSLIETSYFKKMRNEEMNLQLGAGKIRFLPKEKGLRMITNMKNTTILEPNSTGDTFEVKSVDTHGKLSPLLDALSFEKELKPDIMGSSVFGGKSLLYTRYKAYAKKALPTKAKFYFVKVDISDCFDNIDQIKLLDILEDILQHDQYLTRKLISAQPFANKIMRKNRHSCATADTTLDFNGYVGSVSGTCSGCILIEKNSYTIKDTQELCFLLRESLMTSTVKYENKYYKRRRGIAQGSRLSTLLCSFFFGKLEQDKLAYLKEDPDGALFTYIDDFMYITKRRKYAERFLDTMTNDISDFKVSVNKDKCITNIYNDIPEFTWLGFKFDTKTLNVYIDKSAREKSVVASNSTVDYSRKPAAALLNTGVRAIKSKFYNILMDHEINSKQSICRNVYDNFEFAALKIESQTKALSTSIMGFINEKCILNIIVRLGQIAIPLAPHGISKSEMSHLLFLAFYNVFKTRQSKYPHLCLYLKYTVRRYSRSIKQTI